MKKLILILLILSLFLFSLIIGGYFYLKANGKDLVIQKVEQQLGKKIVFDEVLVSFPLTLKIKNLKVEDIGSFEQIICSLNPVYFFLKQIYFPVVEIVNPNIKIYQKTKDSFSLSSLVEVDDGDEKLEKGIEGKSSRNIAFVIFVDRLIIRNGKLSFFTLSEEKEKKLFSLQSIDAKFQEIAFPQKRSRETDFDITATLIGFDNRFNNDDLKAYGWADFYQKNMKAKLQVSGMEGQVNFLAYLVSENNDLTVKGKMNLAFGQKEPKENPKTFEDFFVKTLQSSGARIEMKFDFKTKMDDFQIGEVSLSGALEKNK